MSGFCYLIQSHRGPAQVARLVCHLRTASPDSTILVSHDRAGEPLDAAALEALGGVHVLLTRGGYGDLSHVDRWVEGVRWLRAHGEDPDWLVTLSGQDYPVLPVTAAEAELRDGGHDGYVEHWPVFSVDSHWPAHRARTRYLHRHHRLPALPPPARKVLRAASVVNRLQPFVRLNAMYGTVGVRTPTPLGPGFALHGGSFFTSLGRDCVEYVLAFYEERPAVVEWFRGVLAPEEVFFQTVLTGADRFRLSGDCKRYFDFSAGDGRPRTLGVADLPRLLASGAHFARKFDETVDADVLDRLDATLLEAPSPTPTPAAPQPAP